MSIKYFLARRKEGMISLISAISIIGVALGVASLIIVLSVMNGFDSKVRDKIIGTYSHIMVRSEGGIDDPGWVESKLKRLPEVKSASGFVTGQAILRTGDSMQGVLLKGIDPAEEARVTSIDLYTEGDAADLGKKNIILGSQLMEELGISSGDTVELMVPHSLTDRQSIEFRVAGGFTSGRYDYDANMGIVHISAAQELFRTGQKVTAIGVRLHDGMRVQKVREKVLSALGGYPYMVKTWMDLDRNLVNALALEKKMMFIALGLIILVACFNISGSLIMMVMEKTRDIGILKSVGANSMGVSLIFLIEGAITGVLGTLAGAAAGVFIASRVNLIADVIERLTGVPVFPSDVYYFTEIPVQIDMPDIYVISVFAVILALLAGVYPAWKASRLDPVNAIRYE